MKEAKLAYNVLIQPWITEKAHAVMAQNKYVFKVAETANKTQVRKALESMYQVSVEKVSIVRIHSKKRNYGRYTGMKSGLKKAIVTLKKGSKIELFEGV